MLGILIANLIFCIFYSVNCGGEIILTSLGSEEQFGIVSMSSVRNTSTICGVSGSSRPQPAEYVYSYASQYLALDMTKIWGGTSVTIAPQLVCNLIINVIRNIISLLHNIKLIF